MKRKIYLEDIPLDEAWTVFTTALDAANLWRPLPAEEISVADADKRITADPVWAKISSPHYHACAMDGFALRAKDSEGATETNPVQFVLVPADDLKPSAGRPMQEVNTGHPLPGWANAVIMVEHTRTLIETDGTSCIEIKASVPPWKHVRPMGEDMVATELVLPANHRLRPVDLGAVAGSGHDKLSVYRRPRVAIIPTGTELITAEDASNRSMDPGQIIEYNSIVLAAQVRRWGGVANRWPIIPDEFEAIKSAIREASKNHDLILVNAGSSAGTEDYAASIVQSLGQLLVHGVAIRPGHPVILGLLDGADKLDQPIEQHKQTLEAESESKKVQKTVPIVGVPGYPVSAALTGDIFVEPLLARWQGQSSYKAPLLNATMTRKVLSHTGDDDFVRVAVGRVQDRILATPISRGAGVITSLVRADGIVRIPRFSEGLDAGAGVQVHLYRSTDEIDNTIVVIGSHDLTLDLMAQYLADGSQGLRITSANVGSLGGLIALRRAEAHLAGSHLLDPETGQYNISYIRRYLPDQDVVLVTLVRREQGLIIPAGNPRLLTSWADVRRPEINMVNRQRGAGTRVLFDYELAKLAISPDDVRGYEREEFTHLAVAAAVASGAADAGPGIRAAARALDLDFVPLALERYDLVIPRQHYESDLLRPLLDLLYDQSFRKAVGEMPGYDVDPMGEVVEMG